MNSLPAGEEHTSGPAGVRRIVMRLDGDSAGISQHTMGDMVIHGQETIAASGEKGSIHLLKWVCLLLITQCFEYRQTGFGPSFSLGFTITPDRLAFIAILVLTTWRFTRGEFQWPALGKGGWYTLLFALMCAVSFQWVGRSPFSHVINYLFDFNYIPLAIFVIAKSIPHSRKKLQFISLVFLILGGYLAVNGLFERFGPHTLVWPKYILDAEIGDQFGRTRGSFANSEGLGAAIVVCFLFYLLYVTCAQGTFRYWIYLMIGVTPIVIYTTNQRSVWLSLAVCLMLASIVKSDMKRVARWLVCAAVVGFLTGTGSHFSLWEDETLFSRRQNTVDYRKVNFLANIEMGLANPIFGVGYGNWNLEWEKYFRALEGVNIPDLTDGNHNTFLGRFAELGFVGVIVYLMIFYYMFRVGLGVYKSSEGFERGFSLVFLLVLINYVIGANFSDYRNAPFLNTSLFLLFGTVARIQTEMASRRVFDDPEAFYTLHPEVTFAPQHSAVDDTFDYHAGWLYPTAHTSTAASSPSSLDHTLDSREADDQHQDGPVDFDR